MEKINDKLLNWASILEQGTRDQAVTTVSMPGGILIGRRMGRRR